MSPRTEQILCALGCAAWGALLSAAAFDACGCSPDLPAGYRVNYGGTGGGLSATVPAPVDHDSAISALKAVAEPLAACLGYVVTVQSVDCPPPKKGEVQPCTVLGTYNCNGGVR